MPKGVYERSEEQKRKIGEARKRYFDQHGRVVDIDQRVDRRSYQREYQKIYRKRHKHYYRDLKRKMKSQESNHMENSMKQEVEGLQIEITRLQNVIADLEMKLQNHSSQNVSSPKEDIDDNLYKSVLPSTQACSEEELLKYLL